MLFLGELSYLLRACHRRNDAGDPKGGSNHVGRTVSDGVAEAVRVTAPREPRWGHKRATRRRVDWLLRCTGRPLVASPACGSRLYRMRCMRPWPGVFEIVEKSFVLTVRVTESMLGRIDHLTESLSRPGNRSTRAYALRYVLVKGLDVAEAVRGMGRGRSVGAARAVRAR
jgi:hypothetical protein